MSAEDIIGPSLEQEDLRPEFAEEADFADRIEILWNLFPENYD